MDETPDRQPSPGRLSLERIAQFRSQGPAKPAISGGEAGVEPERIDLDENGEGAPPRLAHRPIPLSARSESDSSAASLPARPTYARPAAPQSTGPVGITRLNPAQLPAANGADRTPARGEPPRIASGASAREQAPEEAQARRLAHRPGRGMADANGSERGTARPALSTLSGDQRERQAARSASGSAPVPRVGVPVSPRPPQSFQTSRQRENTPASSVTPANPANPRETQAAVLRPPALQRAAPSAPEVEEKTEQDAPAVSEVRPVENQYVLDGVAAPAQPAIGLEELIGAIANPPAQTAVLGVCDDGLPVLVDLGDPQPGALLAVTDDEDLRLNLLRTLLQSAALLNSPRSVQFLVLSPQPENWLAWMETQGITRHCLGVERLPNGGQEADIPGSPERWLVKLSGWTDQRRSGSVTGPAVVVLVDDLTAATRLEYDARVNFDWLLKEGPAVRIWPVVGLSTSAARELTRWVRLFKTRLLGPSEDPALFQQLAADTAAGVEAGQFAVRVQQSWLKFRLPVLTGAAA